MPAAELARRRLAAQALSGPPIKAPGSAGAVAVARRLLAIQGQDPRGARLAVRARSTGVRAADVELALTEERSLVLTWLNRGTLHLVAAEDYPLLQALAAPALRTAGAYGMAREGLTPDAGRHAIAVVDDALAQDGPQTSAQLRERLERDGVIGPHTGRQALIHVLLGAAADGVVVRGPLTPDGAHAYARLADWLPQLPPATARVLAARDRALAELARRYLTGHGPAADRELAKWAGLPVRDARAGLTAIASELHERPDGLVELATAAAAPPPPLPPPRLLGAFEPVLMGLASRAQILGDHQAEVVTGGVFRAFMLVRGRAAGLWRIRGDRLLLEPFAPLPTATERALARDSAAVMEFLAR